MNLEQVALEIWDSSMHFHSKKSKNQLTQYNYQQLCQHLQDCDFFSLPKDVDSEQIGQAGGLHYYLIAEIENRRSAIYFQGEPKAGNLKQLMYLYQEIWARSCSILGALRIGDKKIWQT